MIAALDFSECTKLLGPVVPGTVVPDGIHVPGTNYELDPVLGAFNIGALIRWLDWNDTFLGREWGHPSDNFGAILAVAEFVSKQRQAKGEPPLTMRDVLVAAVKAYEIQGVMSLGNCFNAEGLDHVILVRLASTAVVAHLLGCSRDQVLNAISHVFVDGGALRCYRHFPNTGSRKSWAAGDATSRAVVHAFNALKGEMGYPTVLTAPRWGFQTVYMGGKELVLSQPLGHYIMDNILFKASFPAEFHAQTAVECAFALHQAVADSLDTIQEIKIWTQESAVRIIDKIGPLHNPADRDHCLQYMVAVALIHGDLKAEYYEDKFAADPRIDALRNKMVVVEERPFSEDYLDPEKRSIANAICITLGDGSTTERVEVHYPIGHKVRRREGYAAVEAKLASNLKVKFSEMEVKDLMDLFLNAEAFENLSVPEFMDILVRQDAS